MIEDLAPLRDVRVSVRLPETPVAARLVPDGRSLPITLFDGRCEVTVPEFACHCAVAFDY